MNMMPLSTERPRVKLAYYGVQALSNAELLSLILGTGTKTSLELADSVMKYAENIGGLGVAEVCELTEVNGVGSTKASAIVAAMELGRREYLSTATAYKQKLSNSEAIADLVRANYLRPGENREHFVAFCLNVKLQLTSEHLISIGNLDSCPVHPREIFAPAIKNGAASIIVAHTHPSGDPTPSPQDYEVTERLFEASKIIGIKLLDHVVVGAKAHTSLKAEGHIEFE